MNGLKQLMNQKVDDQLLNPTVKTPKKTMAEKIQDLKDKA